MQRTQHRRRGETHERLVRRHERMQDALVDLQTEMAAGDRGDNPDLIDRLATREEQLRTERVRRAFYRERRDDHDRQRQEHTDNDD